MIIKRISGTFLGLLIITTPTAYGMSYIKQGLGPTAKFGSFCLNQSKKALSFYAQHPKSITATLLLGGGAAAGLTYTLVKKNKLLTQALTHEQFLLSKLLRGIRARVPQEDHNKFSAALIKAIKNNDVNKASAYLNSGVKLSYTGASDCVSDLLGALRTAVTNNDPSPDTRKKANAQAEQWQAAGVTLAQTSEATPVLLTIFEQLTNSKVTTTSDSFIYNFEKAKTMIRLKANLDSYDPEQSKKASQLLHKAIAQGKDSVVNLMIEAGCDIGATKDYAQTDETPLHNYIGQLVRDMDTSRIEEFLKTHKEPIKGVKGKKRGVINNPNRNGQTALHLAALNGYARVVQLLVEYGADVNATNNKGETPLMVAVQNSHKESNKQDRPNGAFNQTIQLLLENGADINAQDKNGKTALMHVPSLTEIFTNSQGTNQAMLGIVDTLHRLLTNTSVKLDIQDNDGNTMLHHFLNGHMSTILQINDILQFTAFFKQLGSLQANLDNTIIKQIFESIQVSNKGKLTAITDKLFNSGNINAQNSLGRTPLFKACEMGDSDNVKKLLQKHADINTQDSTGKTPLMVAVSSTQLSKEVQNATIDALLAHKPNLDLVDNDHHDALFYSRPVTNQATGERAATSVLHKKLMKYKSS